MNLYFRLIRTILVSLFGKRVDVTEMISLSLRVFPNDLDFNRHVNNGRYLTLLDLGSIHLFIRSGLLKYMLAEKLRPIIGGVIITYRKGLKLFERCELTMHLAAWDRRWNYFRFEFRNSKGELCAAGFLKGAFVSKNGLYPNDEMIKKFGHKDVVHELPPAVAHWIASEEALTD